MIRVLYDKMRDLNISTLDVHRYLVVAEVEMSQRTLQTHLDTDLNSCVDYRVRAVVNATIASREKLIKELTPKEGT